VAMAAILVGVAVFLSLWLTNGGGHTMTEWALGEAPQRRVDAYIEAVRRGDRQEALACWPASERSGSEFEARRQRVTDELLALGPSLRYRIAGVEWWSTWCCEPSQTRPADASLARLKVEVVGQSGQARAYVFDVGARVLYGEPPPLGNPVRGWRLSEVYPAAEAPLGFRWPPPTPTPIPAVTLKGYESDASTWQRYEIAAWPIALSAPRGWIPRQEIASLENGPVVVIWAGGRQLVIARRGDLPADLPPAEGELQVGTVAARRHVQHRADGRPSYVLIVPAQPNDMLRFISYALPGLPEDEAYVSLFDAVVKSIEFQ